MKRVALYPPEEFSSESRLAEVLKYLRWPIVEERDNPELRIWVSDKPCGRNSMLNSIAMHRDKWLLGTAFRSVFGYPLNVDPATYHGYAVRKTPNHGMHGTVVKCPIAERERRWVHQKLITNHNANSHVEEWRVSLYRSSNQVMLVSRKWLLKDDYGFSRHERRSKTFTFDVPNPFSITERFCLLQLAEKMGVQIGDFDAIRDLDGKLYVVDATVNTSVPPMRIYNNCTFDSYIARHAEVFKGVFG